MPTRSPTVFFLSLRTAHHRPRALRAGSLGAKDASTSAAEGALRRSAELVGSQADMMLRHMRRH